MKHQRRSVRLQGYDYSQAGLYFLTICTEYKRCLFGEVVGGRMKLNPVGSMVEKEWQNLSVRFSHIELDYHVVMPNHIHGIINIAGVWDGVAWQGEQQDGGAPALGNIVGAFKSLGTNEYIRRVKTGEWPPFERRLWQRNYYEHIIRDEKELYHVQEYIRHNPSKYLNPLKKPVKCHSSNHQ